jgi:hypothetical protein
VLLLQKALDYQIMEEQMIDKHQLRQFVKWTVVQQPYAKHTNGLQVVSGCSEGLTCEFLSCIH